VNGLSNDGSEKRDQPQDQEGDRDNVKDLLLVFFVHDFLADRAQPTVQLKGGNLPPQDSRILALSLWSHS
jgi:hypothetical protein